MTHPSINSTKFEPKPAKAGPFDEDEFDIDDLPDAPAPKLLGKKSAKRKPSQEEESSSSHPSQGSLFGPTLEERMAQRAIESEAEEERTAPWNLLWSSLVLILMGFGLYWLAGIAPQERGIGIVRPRRISVIVAIFVLIFGHKWLAITAGVIGIIGTVLSLMLIAARLTAPNQDKIPITRERGRSKG